ncbi:putative folate-biopterin transporter 4 [Acorus calamus]|uniref:Folate-biopterin transporter 4 n=1 Tax=Acorus calamus TaxID=4465 RepID=A0AAV9E5P7_ACOCL|nr:putative folate-biopterin transporter 4 [Acorus calamus]
MMGWLGRMKAEFGSSFLWLVCSIYFTQGFRSFVWTAISYQLKDVLKLSPSASQFVVSAAFFPWSIKPLYGILSDCIPIRGRKRVPYLVFATILSLFPWLILGLTESLRSSHISLMILLIVQNIGSAMADVVIDAMIAEAVRSERAAFAGDLQSLSWFTMALGGICGSLLGGYALTSLQIETNFLLFSILPAIQLLSCALVDEIPASAKVFAENELSKISQNKYSMANGNVRTEDSLSPQQSGENEELHEKMDTNDAVVVKPANSTFRRKKNQKKRKKRENILKSDIPERHRSLSTRSFASLKSAVYSLCHAFRKPIILRPMAWFFFAHITVPNLSTAMFYYQTEVLHLEASFLGTVRVVGWFGLMLGTYIYNRHLKQMRLRRILMWTHIGLAVLTLLDIVLVSRLNIQYGISDKLMVICGSALADAINQFKLMPFLILSGQLCPPGIEGTLFALFMSINNLGNTLGSFLGAALASALNISAESFENIIYAISIQLFSTFIPVAFLFLIPKDATGIST